MNARAIVINHRWFFSSRVTVRTLFNSLAVIGLCGIAPSIALAAPITFQFSTKVQEMRGDPAGVIGRPVAVDDVLHGHVIWDGAASDTEPVDPAFLRPCSPVW